MKKRLISIFIALILMLSAASCAKPEAKTSEIELWSIRNTEKILQDKQYDDSYKSLKSLNISLAKGEYESGQIIISSNTDINSIKVEKSDLKCGDKVLSADCLSIYFQKYIKITQMSSPTAPDNFGNHPDAIVPLYAIQNYGEDKVKANQNQGLWITVKTPVDCAAGEYTGNFKVILDGKETLFPINVNVWDFVMPQEPHQKTSFNNFREYIIGGELDNSIEMMEKYYEFLLDYRVTLYDMPLLNNTPEQFIKQAKKYAADNRCNAYNMEFEYYRARVIMDGVINKDILETDYTKLKTKLKLLAEESTPNLNLFSKLYLWDQSLDEPEGTKRVEEANYKTIMFKRALVEATQELDDIRFDYAAHGITRDDILGLEIVITQRYTSSMPDLRTYCPLVSDFSTDDQRAKYEELREIEYNSTWWYDAWCPQYPYPNYRIEETSLGSRVMGWMQKDYDISGLLYWATSVYNKLGYEFPLPRDAYDDPYSFQSITMDGCLTYPGRPYGIDGPVASIRLESIRDGLEDYEYLWYLEELLNDADKKYLVDFDYDKITRSLFDSLYSGVIPKYNDSNAIFKAREEIAEMIELLQGDEKIVVNTDSQNPKDNTVTLFIYADKEVEVYAENNLLKGEASGSGIKYTYVKQLNGNNNYANFKFVMGGQEKIFNKYIGNSIYSFALSNENEILLEESIDESSGKHITLSKNTDNESLSADAIKVEIQKTASTDIFYSPSVSVIKSKSFASLDISEVDNMDTIIYNANNVDKKMFIILYAGDSEFNLLEKTLKPGANKISMKQIYSSNWSALKSADKIVFQFEQCKTESKADIYYIDNFLYSKIV